MELLIQKLNENAVIPERATDGSAGMDLTACIPQPYMLKAGDRALIPTGIAIGLASPEYAALILARSGLAIKHGITLSNSVGLIDSDYRGEIKVGLVNISQDDYTIQPYERIAQLVTIPIALLPVREVERLDETVRGHGGFGSTGK